MRQAIDFWPIKGIIYKKALVLLLSGRYGDNSVSGFFKNKNSSTTVKQKRCFLLLFSNIRITVH